MNHRIWKNSLILSFIFGVSLLHSATVQPWTTPEAEETIVLAASKKTAVPLSEALSQLIQGISEQTFDQEFISKIAQAEP